MGRGAIPGRTAPVSPVFSNREGIQRGKDQNQARGCFAKENGNLPILEWGPIRSLMRSMDSAVQFESSTV